MDFPNLSGRAVKTIVAFPHPLFHPPNLRSLKRPVNSLQGKVADPGEGPGGSPPPNLLVLDQSEARRAENFFLETGPPLSKDLDDWLPHLSQGLDLTLEQAFF